MTTEPGACDEGEAADRPDRRGVEDPAREPLVERPAAGRAAYEGNRQQVTGPGFAFMGEARDIHVHTPLDEADDRVVVPRFREGPYPAAEVEDRLKVFIEPSSYSACRAALGRGPLLLRGARGTGASTAAFALLRDAFGAGGITGLDGALDLTRWSPSAARGYVLQGLSPESADALSGNALVALADELRRAGAGLVVVLNEGQRLPSDTAPWQVRHVPPDAYDVARGCLSAMVRDGDLPRALLDAALARLAGPEFADYLGAGRSPGVAVDVATELREVVLGERSAHEAVDNLRLGGADIARETLEAVRGTAEGLALAAAAALLEHQDRTVVHQYAADLGARIAERRGRGVAAAAAGPEDTGRPDFLGRGFEDQLADVRARLLPRQMIRANGSRYWTQPVAFRGRHQAELLLRRLWWDHDGIAELLLATLYDMPYQPGMDLAAGQALGRVLCYSTGPRWLRPLSPFASSDLRRHRRLAAYALGEIAQTPDLSGAVRAHLREWSRQRSLPVRCTVAETCAGSFGLGSPAAALHLLDAVLDGAEGELPPDLRTAVSFALGVLLAEESNRAAVLGLLAGWLADPAGALRRAYAVHAVTALSQNAAGGPFRSKRLRPTVAEMMTARQDGLPSLVVAALDNPASHGAMSAALSAAAQSPDVLRRAAAADLRDTLRDASTGHPGVVAFLLARYRSAARTSFEASERTRS